MHSESNFNFVKMHLISHFRDHINMFGNIPMYSTEYGELEHKKQIRHEWRRSNTINAARRILSSYGRQPAITMSLLNLEFFQHAGADLPTEVVEHLEKTRPPPTPPANHRILKGGWDNIHEVVDFGRACNLSPEMICRELIRYSRLSLPPERRMPEKSRDTSSSAGGTTARTGDPGSYIPGVRCLRHTPVPMHGCLTLS